VRVKMDISYKQLVEATKKHNPFEKFGDMINIAPKLGDYELERKFLFNPTNLPDTFIYKCQPEIMNIEQYYITHEETPLRLRKTTWNDGVKNLRYQYELTYKQDTEDATRRVEINKSIDEKTFLGFYNKYVCGKDCIEFVTYTQILKIRYIHTSNNNMVVSFDFFLRYPNLCLCEVETVYPEYLKKFSPKLFFDKSILNAYVKEVTDDKRFSNFNISKNKDEELFQKSLILDTYESTDITKQDEPDTII
jgi:CYTH domain-containing protein